MYKFSHCIINPVIFMTTPLRPEKWAQKHSDYLYGYAITRIYVKDDALDLVQETFYAALKARESFKGDSSERTWLIAILKRKIIDYYRKKVSRKESELQTGCADDNYFNASGFLEGHWKKERMPTDWTYTDRGIENEEFEAIIKKCLALLPSKAEACFNLKVMEEYSSEEICKELDITASNLGTILHRAKLQLRECMEINWFGKKSEH